MKTYARIFDRTVYEIFSTNDDITELFTAGIEWIELTDATAGVTEGWTYDAATGVFAAPVPYVPTAEETLATNTATRDYLLGLAALAIAPLQDAVDLEMATVEEAASLKLWKQYRVAVSRIDLTLAAATWPVMPGS